MSFTYDLDTLVGQVRNLIRDTVEATASFSDEELTVILTQEGESVIYAAAAALEGMATTLAMRGKVRLPDLEVDGTAQAKVLLDLAAKLREQAASGESDEEVEFDWAEQVYPPFGYRERIRNEYLRSGV